MKRFPISMCLVAMLALVGCQSTPQHDHGAHASAVVNQNCPIMGGPVDTSGATVSYQGHTIGFCCDGCAPKWNKLPAAEKDEHLKKMLSR
ncbi:MAG: hypothetical protein ACYTGW_03825 [Planctomycetota bacterium]